MKAYEIINKLGIYGEGKDYSKSCDSIKAGNPEIEVKYVDCGEVYTYTDSVV